MADRPWRTCCFTPTAGPIRPPCASPDGIARRGCIRSTIPRPRKWNARRKPTAWRSTCRRCRSMLLWSWIYREEVTGMQTLHTRREWLWKTAAAVSGAYGAGRSMGRAAEAPTAPVAVARCRTYDPAELVPAMRKMSDQLGGLGRLVKGKTVAIKINLTGSPTYRLGYLPLGDTHYTHPHTIAAAAHLMAEAGARRIRLLESPWSTADPVEEYILRANWEPRDILGAAPNVEFENTNYLGTGKKYARLTVPFGGYVFPAFDLNHSYADCDVFVSLAKMKEHATAGI